LRNWRERLTNGGNASGCAATIAFTATRLPHMKASALGHRTDGYRRLTWTMLDDVAALSESVFIAFCGQPGS